MNFRWRSVGRFAAAVMAVSGVLLLAEAALTLLWQEPISGIRAAREQNRLERELPKQAAALADARRLGAARDRAERAADLAARFSAVSARWERSAG